MLDQSITHFLIIQIPNIVGSVCNFCWQDGQIHTNMDSTRTLAPHEPIGTEAVQFGHEFIERRSKRTLDR